MITECENAARNTETTAAQPAGGHCMTDGKRLALKRETLVSIKVATGVKAGKISITTRPK